MGAGPRGLHHSRRLEGAFAEIARYDASARKSGAGPGAGPSSARRWRGSFDWMIDGWFPSVERSVGVLDWPPTSM